MVRVAVFGAGIMGEPIAAHLLLRGYEVAIVAHRNRGPVERLLARGAGEYATPAEAADFSDVALLLLPTSREVEEVLFSRHGVAASRKAGYVVADMGTCDPAETRLLATRFAALGGHFIDAPVTGGVEGARGATLTVMAGGDLAILDLIRPVFETFSRKIYHFGPVGAGHTAKLIQNMIGWIEVAGIAEGLALAKATRLDLATFFDMLTNSHSNSPIVQMMVPKVLAGRFDEIDFRLDLAWKDIRQAADLAGRSTALPMSATRAASEIFRLGCAAGFGHQDWTAVVRGLESMLGEELRASIEAIDKGERSR